MITDYNGDPLSIHLLKSMPSGDSFSLSPFRKLMHTDFSPISMGSLSSCWREALGAVIEQKDVDPFINLNT